MAIVDNVFGLPYFEPSLPKNEVGVSARRLRELSQGCDEEGLYCKICGAYISSCKCWNPENRAKTILEVQKLLVEIPEEK